MGSPTSQTEIVNAALARIGSTERLISIDDPGSNSARRMVALWDMARRLLLSRHPWNFAIRRANLNASTEVPANGWQYQFLLPADLLRWLPWAHGEAQWFDGEREGAHLLANVPGPLPIRYIRDHEEVPSWSPGFVESQTSCLCEWTSLGVSESLGLTDRMMQAADRALRIGKRIDGLETGRCRRTDVVGQSEWLTRRSRPYGWRGR